MRGLFSWRGIFCEYIQVWKSCLDIFVSPSLVCLNYLKMIVDFTEFGVLEFFWDRQNSPFLWIGSARTCRAFYFWFLTWIEVAVHVSVFIIFYHSFLFLANAVPFILFFSFWRTQCRFFSCFFVQSNSLALEASCNGLCVGCLFSFDLSNVYWCDPGRSYMDG